MVYASPQTVMLTKNDVSSIFDDTYKLAVTAPNMKDLKVTKSKVPMDQKDSLISISYTIMSTGYSSGDNALISFTLDQKDGFDFARPITISNEKNEELGKVLAVDEAVSLVTTDLGTINLSQTILEIPEEGPSYILISDPTLLQDGGEYLMICYAANKFFLMEPEVVEKSNNAASRIGFNLESIDKVGEEILTGNYLDQLWTLTFSEGGSLIGDGEKYIHLENTNDYAITGTLENDGDPFTININNGMFTFSSGSSVLNYNSRGLINGYPNDPAHFFLYQLVK